LLQLIFTERCFESGTEPVIPTRGASLQRHGIFHSVQTGFSPNQKFPVEGYRQERSYVVAQMRSPTGLNRLDEVRVNEDAANEVSVRFLPSIFKVLSAVRVSQRRVDLVGEDVFGERFANRQIEACEQLG
jgi:hypothetical protein